MNELSYAHTGHTLLLDGPASHPGPRPSRPVPSQARKPKRSVWNPAAMSVSCSEIALSTAATAVRLGAEAEGGLSDAELVDELGRASGVAAAWFAHQVQVVAELHRRPVMGSGRADPGGGRGIDREALVCAEIAPVLGISEDTAKRFLSRALVLTSRLPGTMALLSQGRVDQRRAEAVADLVGRLADWAYAGVLELDGSPRLAEQAASALAEMVEARVLGRAERQRVDQLRDCLRRAIARVAPAYASELHDATVAGRDVFVDVRGQDGMGFLGAHLPIVETKACWAALDERARWLRDRGDLRTLAQLRADLLVQAILGPGAAEPSGIASTTSSNSGPGPGPTFGREWAPKDVARGVKAHVQVTVDLGTLLGLNDNPAHLTGNGTITAQTARSLAHAAGSTWRRLITDPISGTLLDYGRTTYRPPTALADHVIARDVTCSHPGCTRPAENCDLDHLLPFPRGATCECNLHPLCRRHHRLKHQSPWKSIHPAPSEQPKGSLKHTSPTGHTYTTYRPALTEPASPPPPPF